jgi:nucleoid-associated protein EbfC
MFDIQKMLKQAQKMQEQMTVIQDELEKEEITASAGNGAVVIVANGKYEFKKVTISPEVAGDAALLEDLMLAALKDLSAKIAKLTEEKMAKVTSGMNLNIPGLKLPF